MTFDEFEALAAEQWERIPAEYRQGVDGIVVERGAVPHPTLPDIYTLGECLTESYPSDFGGPDTTRSVVVLHYGSFFRLSRHDDSFDWQAELWETLTHELQHHLESLATDDALGDMDYAADENYKRYHGDAFDTFFFRSGVPEDGWFRVEDEFFLEAPVPAPGAPVHFVWDDVAYEVVAPHEPGDVTFLTVTDGVDAGPALLHIVLVAHRSWLAVLRDAVRNRPLRVTQHDVTAYRAPDDPA